jgi:hypothetical protein
VEQTRDDHVVDEASFAAEESRIFPPLHRRAKEFCAHGSLNRRLYTRFTKAES